MLYKNNDKPKLIAKLKLKINIPISSCTSLTNFFTINVKLTKKKSYRNYFYYCISLFVLFRKDTDCDNHS